MSQDPVNTDGRGFTQIKKKEEGFFEKKHIEREARGPRATRKQNKTSHTSS